MDRGCLELKRIHQIARLRVGARRERIFHLFPVNMSNVIINNLHIYKIYDEIFFEIVSETPVSRIISGE